MGPDLAIRASRRAEADFQRDLRLPVSGVVLVNPPSRFKAAEELAEVILDPRQVHLVQQDNQQLVSKAVPGAARWRTQPRPSSLGNGSICTKALASSVAR